MGKAIKRGLDYFPLDVGFFYDQRIQLIEADFGIKGGYVALRLLTLVYQEGYCYQWGADQCSLLVKSMGVVGVSDSLVQEIVQGLVGRGLFEKSVYDRFRVLTSAAIQEVYQTVVKASRLRRPGIDARYCLLTEVEPTLFEQEEINATSMQHFVHKAKERKGKETPSSYEKGGVSAERKPLEDGKEEYSLCMDSLAIPTDGVNRNMEGLLRCFREFGIRGKSAHELLKLSNYGEVGEQSRIWRLFREIRNSRGNIHSPEFFLLKKMRSQ